MSRGGEPRRGGRGSLGLQPHRQLGGVASGHLPRHGLVALQLQRHRHGGRARREGQLHGRGPVPPPIHLHPGPLRLRVHHQPHGQGLGGRRRLGRRGPRRARRGDGVLHPHGRGGRLAQEEDRRPGRHEHPAEQDHGGRHGPAPRGHGLGGHGLGVPGLERRGGQARGGRGLGGLALVRLRALTAARGVGLGVQVRVLGELIQQRGIRLLRDALGVQRAQPGGQVRAAGGQAVLEDVVLERQPEGGAVR